MPEPLPPRQDEPASPAPKRVPWGKWLTLAGLIVALAIAVSAWLGKSFHEFLKQNWQQVTDWRDENPWLFGGLFFLTYVGAVGLSIPIAVPLSLAAGALYGRWYGTLFVSFASTAGAALAFLASRYLFRGLVQRRFGERLQAINRGVEIDGAYYLFSLRLQPVVPFWLINLGMGLTPMRLVTYWIVSQIGMLPGTFVYVNVGASAGEIAEAKDVWPFLLSLALLGLVPLALRLLFRWMSQRRRAIMRK
jgi:uncharacterized membrane protein YdjX (TVP38/TMEM64 family)